MTTYAYARVSSSDQCLDRQLDAFAQMGVEPQNIFTDKESGKDFDRVNYQRLTCALQRGDLLVIKSIDRLGRNYTAILHEWDSLTNLIGANILVLDMPLLDTRSKQNGLVGKFISDVVLQVLSFVAENERQNICQRQKEGIAAALARGVKFGRPCTTYSDEAMELLKMYHDKKISMQQVAQKLGLKRSNCYYHAKRAKLLLDAAPPQPEREL